MVTVAPTAPLVGVKDVILGAWAFKLVVKNKNNTAVVSLNKSNKCLPLNFNTLFLKFSSIFFYLDTNIQSGKTLRTTKRVK
jgi:hypothetical protein